MKLKFIADDGKEFDYESECLEYEREILKSTIKAKPLADIDFTGLYDTVVSEFDIHLERNTLGNMEEYIGWQLITLIYGAEWEKVFQEEED